MLERKGEKGRGGGADGDEEGCPYQLTLPPLTIQLPKQFRMLERTVKELQSLKETVGKLRSSCQECRGGGAGGRVPSSSGTTGGIGGQQQRQQQADQGRHGGGVRGNGGEVTGDGTGQRPGWDPQEQQLYGTSREEAGDGGADGSEAAGHGSTAGKDAAQNSGNMMEMQVSGRSERSGLRAVGGELGLDSGLRAVGGALGLDSADIAVGFTCDQRGFVVFCLIL